MRSIGNQFTSIEQVTNQYLNKPNQKNQQNNAQGVSFNDILAQKQLEGAKIGELKFSKHAASRLEQREITLSDAQKTRLNEGAKMAEAKGIKDSLVIVDSLAFIVNVPNKTVITAMDQKQANEKIFTNIDGAVIN